MHFNTHRLAAISGVIIKSAAPTYPQPEAEEPKPDVAADKVQRRLMLRTLISAIQGGVVGGLGGTLYAAGESAASKGESNPMIPIAAGALGGAAIGGGLGYGTGKVRQSLGMDPLLSTIATARD